jgi:nucleoside-diphosphate-sugar epimerase
MKLLILGGSGFLGRALVRHLAALQDEIDVVVRSEESARRLRSACATAAPISEDDAAGRAYDRVINLVVDYGRGKTALSDLVQANLLYPLALIESVSAEVVINISSALPEAYSDYAFSKKMLERSLERVGARRGSRVLNVHLHNMYGPGSDGTNLVTALIEGMKVSKPIELSSGRNSRDFIYIDDVVGAITALCAHPERVPHVPGIDIGSGKAVRLSDLVERLQGKIGGSSRILYGARPDNPQEISVLEADLSAIGATGWAPAWSLDAGLDATIASQQGI